MRMELVSGEEESLGRADSGEWDRQQEREELVTGEGFEFDRGESEQVASTPIMNPTEVRCAMWTVWGETTGWREDRKEDDELVGDDSSEEDKLN